jgi:Fe-S-cluster containining protein
VVTDSAEVFPLGTAKAQENLAFRRYLSAHGIDEKPFQIIAAEIQKQIDCTACANCCRCSVVPVSDREIEKIAAHLGATPEAVYRAFTVPDPDAPSRRILASSRQGCIFLTGNLCSIYAARPATCRDFPHVAVGSHTLGGRASSHGRWAALCPIIYNAIEAYKRVTGFHPHHAAGKQAGQC